MKKILLTVVATMIATLSWSYDYNADYIEVNGVHYKYDRRYTNTNPCPCSVYGITSTDSIINIPSELSYNNTFFIVTSIGDEAFYKNKTVKKITLPKSVTSIGKKAFKDSSLKEINLSNILRLAEEAFSGASIEELTLPDSICFNGKFIFAGCNSLKKLVIPRLDYNEIVKTIDETQFQGCRSLDSVFVYAEGSIDLLACDNIQYIEYHSSEAQRICSNQNLRTVVLGKEVTRIGASAFSTSLVSSIVIPDGITSIGNFAFGHCSKLKDITFPKQLKRIEDSAFDDCFCLTSLHLPDSMEYIGKQAFDGCDSIKTIYLPSALDSIGVEVFSTKQCNIYYNGECRIEHSFRSYDIGIKLITNLTHLSNLFKRNSAFKTIYAVEGKETYVPVVVNGYRNECAINDIQDSVSIMNINDKELSVSFIRSVDFFSIDGENYSDNAKNMKTFNYSLFPSLQHEFNHIGVCGINKDDINYADIKVLSSGNLVNQIDISNINNIKFLKVSGDLNGTDILVIRRMENIEVLDMTDANIVNGGNSYFDRYTCSENSFGEYILNGKATLRNVFLPKTIKSIKEKAFQNCSKLLSIVIPNTVEEIDQSAFAGCGDVITIKIEEGDSYFCVVDNNSNYEPLPSPKRFFLGREQCDYWNYKIYKKRFLTSETKFYNVEKINTAIVGDELDVVTPYAFSQGSNLETFIIGKNIKGIGHYSFAYCTSLQKVVLPSSVIKIDSWAFRGCNNMESINLPSGLEEIGYGAFEYCSSLKEINLPNSLIEIGEWAFAYCSSITRISITEGITTIRENSFRDCNSLQHVTFPTSLKTIEGHAFSNCVKLDNVIIPNSVVKIGGFSGCTSLSKISLSKNLTTIEHGTFGGCSSLSHITIPSEVTYIGGQAFGYCGNLTTFISLNSTPPEIAENTFEELDYSSCTLNVPQGSKALYWLHPYWEKFINMNELTQEQIEALPVEEITTDNIGNDISIENGVIRIHGDNVHCVIYKLDGEKIYDNKANDSISLPNGIYVIRVNNKTVKVRL